MKNIFTYIFLILIVSCSSTNQKEKLIGNWYAQNGKAGILEFQFYNDSLVVYDVLGKHSRKWKVKNGKSLIITNKEKLTYEYQLDSSRRKLNIKFIGDTIIEYPELLKAKDAFDFFQILNDIEIELPTQKTEFKTINYQKNLFFNIYAGYKNNNLIVKTDSTSDLKNLEIEVNKFIGNSRDELTPFLRFNLIADKKISESQIDSIKNHLKKTSIKGIFRTYKREQNDYINDLDWVLKKEKN